VGRSASRLLGRVFVFMFALAAVVPAATSPAAAASPNIEWTASLTADGPLSMTHIVPDGTGVIVAGTVDGTISGQTRAGFSDVFVAAFRASGSLRWVLQFGTPGVDWLEGLAGDGAAVYVVGRTDNSFSGNMPRSQTTAFIARLNTSGSLLWAKEYEREWSAYFHSVAVGPNGSAVVVGQANDRDPQLRGAIIRRYGAGGGISWTRTLPKTFLRDVTVDDGGITVSGSAPWDPEARISLRGPWLARYSFAGSQRWSRFVYGTNSDTGEIVEARGGIDVLAAGQAGILALGDTTQPATGLPPGSTSRVFGRLYDYGGSISWTIPAAAASAVAECNGFLLAGAFQGSDEYFGGRVVALNSTGAERWRFEQRGSVGDEWAYNDVARAGSRVFVVREHRQHEPTGPANDLIALSGVPAPVGCTIANPKVTAPQPSMALVGATASRTGAPMVLEWSGTGGRPGTVRYQLRRSINGGAWKTVATGLVEASIIRKLKPGRSYRFGVRAVDADGRTSAWADGPSFFVGARQERSTRVSYTGQWTQVPSSSYFGGYLRYTSQDGATARTTVNARAVGLIAALGPDRGEVNIYIDGRLAETVNLYSPVVTNRVLVFRRDWDTTAKHTIKIEAVKPDLTNRWRSDLDAFVFWR
jgi:hypothetical protein